MIFQLTIFTASMLFVVSNAWSKQARRESLNQNKYELLAVNYHFTRRCNYQCGFCFHTAKTSHVEPLEKAKQILREIREHGCEKINFAGGEPFTEPHMLGEMVKYCKEELGFPSVSIISNGSKITLKWMEEYGKYLDILGISCDSMNEATNKAIGRGTGNHLKFVRQASLWCQEYGIKFKLNTVVCSHNWKEDMSELIKEVHPIRWKIFQALALQGENVGEGAKRQIAPFLIDNTKFQFYVNRHKALIDPDIMKVEDNNTMQSSYFLIDEYGRFLDSSTGGKVPTRSILEVGVPVALQELLGSSGGGFNPAAFEARDGDYQSGSWSRDIEDLGKGSCT